MATELAQPVSTPKQEKMCIIAFSGDLDKAMAVFNLATGAAASGMEVTIFFTFWGINMLKKANKPKTGGTSLLGKMFGAMMPKDNTKLPISQMNMGGMGAFFMKKQMSNKRIQTLPEFMDLAKELGIKMIACSMSMDVMEIPKQDLDWVDEYAGVAGFLAEAQGAEITLFI